MSPAALLIVLVITALHDFCNGAETVPLTKKFPAILVFGDSTVDTGNNNYIATPLKADHPPYGKDFPGGVPTGRFSNGKLVPDMLASMVGIKERVPPFLDPKLSDEDILTGVSFASAGSGYDDLTASISRVIPVSQQPAYFTKYIQRLESIAGKNETQRILNAAAVIISAGTNDFIFNVYDIPTRRIEFNVDQYQGFVQKRLQNLVQQVYRLGCRKMVVVGLPPIGCLPIQTTIKYPILRSCSEKENADAQAYNDKLQKLLPQLQTQLPGSIILYADIYNPLMDIINNPPKFGLVEAGRGCCGTGLVEAGPLCTPLTPVCANSSQYVFYDSIHPTESTYTVLSQKLYQSLISKLSH